MLCALYGLFISNTIYILRQFEHPKSVFNGNMIGICGICFRKVLVRTAFFWEKYFAERKNVGYLCRRFDKSSYQISTD